MSCQTQVCGVGLFVVVHQSHPVVDHIPSVGFVVCPVLDTSS